jgi:hypothetical protein
MTSHATISPLEAADRLALFAEHGLMVNWTETRPVAT